MAVEVIDVIVVIAEIVAMIVNHVILFVVVEQLLLNQNS